MNRKDFGNQLKDTVVQIIAIKENDTVIQCTGVVYTYKEENKIIPLILSDYNKLDKIKSGYIIFNTHNNGEKEGNIKVSFDTTVIKKLGVLDLAAIPIASVINKISNLYYKSIDATITLDESKIEMLTDIEDVIYVGYAKGIDNKPIVKKSITAIPIDDNAIFYLDTNINVGMSGSPVFIYNKGLYPVKDGVAMGDRILFVGILKDSILPNNYTQNGLNMVINSYSIKSEIDILVKNMMN